MYRHSLVHVYACSNPQAFLSCIMGLGMRLHTWRCYRNQYLLAHIRLEHYYTISTCITESHQSLKSNLQATGGWGGYIDEAKQGTALFVPLNALLSSVLTTEIASWPTNASSSPSPNQTGFPGVHWIFPKDLTFWSNPSGKWHFGPSLISATGTMSCWSASLMIVFPTSTILLRCSRTLKSLFLMFNLRQRWSLRERRVSRNHCSLSHWACRAVHFFFTIPSTAFTRDSSRLLRVSLSSWKVLRILCLCSSAISWNCSFMRIFSSMAAFVRRNLISSEFTNTDRRLTATSCASLSCNHHKNKKKRRKVSKNADLTTLTRNQQILV